MKTQRLIHLLTLLVQGTFAFHGSGFSKSFGTTSSPQNSLLPMKASTQVEQPIAFKQQEHSPTVGNWGFERSKRDSERPGGDPCKIDAVEYQTMAKELHETIDIKRENTRLDSLQQYVLVATLTTTSSFHTVMGLNISEANTSSLFVGDLALIVSALSAISGIYSIINFSMCVMYGKTALGMGRDNMYEYFLKATEEERTRGFQAFQVSLTLFMSELMLIAVSKAQGNLQLPFLAVLMGATLLMVEDWNSVSEKAEQTFTNSMIPVGSASIFDEMQEWWSMKSKEASQSVETFVSRHEFQFPLVSSPRRLSINMG